MFGEAHSTQLSPHLVALARLGRKGFFLLPSVYHHHQQQQLCRQRKTAAYSNSSCDCKCKHSMTWQLSNKMKPLEGTADCATGTQCTACKQLLVTCKLCKTVEALTFAMCICQRTIL
jgi:hypothetical protein